MKKDEKKMKTFEIVIEEMVSQKFEIEAETLEEALEKGEQGYRNCEYVLAPGDLVCKQISGADPSTGDCTEWYEF